LGRTLGINRNGYVIRALKLPEPTNAFANIQKKACAQRFPLKMCERT
jgi:hypothetical protein